MKRILAALLLATLLFCGCSDYKKLEFKGYDLKQIESPTFDRGKLNSKMCLVVDMNNPTSQAVELLDLKAVVHKSTKDVFLTAEATSTASLAARSEEKVSIPLDVTIHNPLAAVLSLANLSDMTADLDMHVRKGARTNHIVKKNIPVKDLIEQAGKDGMSLIGAKKE